MSIWEFSGYQPYYIVYDQFVGDVNCIHVVVVDVSEPRDVQLSQLLYWLRFITARIRISQPIGKFISVSLFILHMNLNQLVFHLSFSSHLFGTELFA